MDWVEGAVGCPNCGAHGCDQCKNGIIYVKQIQVPEGHIDWNLIGQTPLEPNWLIPQRVIRNHYLNLFALEGVGKSLLLLDWARQSPVNVGYIDNEMSDRQVLARAKKMGVQPEDMKHIYYKPLHDLVNNDVDFMMWVAQYELGLVILDTFSATITGDENSAMTVNEFEEAIALPYKQDMNGTLIVADHKTSKDQEATTAQGSAAKGRKVDMSYELLETGVSMGGHSLLTLAVRKDREGVLGKGTEFGYELQTGETLSFEASQPVQKEEMSTEPGKGTNIIAVRTHMLLHDIDLTMSRAKIRQAIIDTGYEGNVGSDPLMKLILELRE